MTLRSGDRASPPGSRAKASARALPTATALLLLALFGRTVGAGLEARSAGVHWVGTWAAAPQPFLPGSLKTFHDQTLRLIVRTSLGGERLRVRLSNTYGDRPLRIGAAHVARRTADSAIDPASDRNLTFSGQPSVTVRRGATAVSDAVQVAAPALSDLAIRPLPSSGGDR